MYMGIFQYNKEKFIKVSDKYLRDYGHIRDYRPIRDIDNIDNNDSFFSLYINLFFQFLQKYAPAWPLAFWDVMISYVCN